MRNAQINLKTPWACGVMAALCVALFYAAAQEIERPLYPLQYSLRVLPYTSSTLKPPILPDLTQYNIDEIRKKIPAAAQGLVKIAPMIGSLGLEKFVEPKYIQNYIKRQNRSEPLAIHIISGTYTLEMLLKAINNSNYLSENEGVYTLGLPIHINEGAALIIDGENSNLRMSQNKGAFIANSGLFFMLGGELSAWNEQKNNYAYFQNKKEFRPFLLSWSGAQVYFANARIMHLGFASSKAYGISFSASAPMLDKQPNKSPPTGWIINSYLEGLYYAFYSYEADDIVLLDNKFNKNIVYAIDPHDRSRRLIIARNLVTQTQHKHGIILSREVNDSFILYNKIYNNNGAGIMLDRDCRNTVIAFNESNNNSDGITLFESPDTFLYNNWVSKNLKTGIRVRNSQNIMALNNSITENKGTGVKIYTQKLGFTDQGDPRDLLMDPYKLEADLTIEGGSVNLNAAGNFRIDQADFLDIRNVSVLSETDFLRAPLSVYNTQAFTAIQKGETRLLFEGKR